MILDLLNPPNVDEFYEQVHVRRVPIKSLLLNQSFSAGVGNWIADEILYQSGIHPGHYTDTLSFSQVSRIYDNMLLICKTAVSLGANYTLFPSDWIFLHRWNKGKKGVNKLNGQEIVYVSVN